MRLIWHADGLLERDWLRDMLGDLIDEEHVDLDCTLFLDDAIHVISSNVRPLSFYEDYAASCRVRAKHLVLLHLSDEYFSGGYRLYRHFDAVIRNFRTYLAACDGILTIPEGYPNGTASFASGVPLAIARPYAWSFVGEIKTTRGDMIEAFAPFGRSFVKETASISDEAGEKLPKSAYDAILRDSVFSPCPMGNAVLETWRLYESLELGCIPLVERRPTLDYFAALFGQHPIPTFDNWLEARIWAETLHGDQIALVQLQKAIDEWWRKHKARTRAAIARQLAQPSAAPALGRFATLPRNRASPIHQPLRLAELLRHQNRNSLARRLRRPAAPLRRILEDGFRP